MQSAGVFFYCTDTDRSLFLLRSDQRTYGYWGLPGGKIEDNESLMDGVKRECMEEMSFFPENGKLIPIQCFVNNDFAYHTFFCEVEYEFIPVLNSEHLGYCWVQLHHSPKPLHPGLFNTLSMDTVRTKIDMLTKKAG